MSDSGSGTDLSGRSRYCCQTVSCRIDLPGEDARNRRFIVKILRRLWANGDAAFFEIDDFTDASTQFFEATGAINQAGCQAIADLVGVHEAIIALESIVIKKLIIIQRVGIRIENG